MNIDYELLLAKYIEHVGAEEGTTFIGRIFLSSSGQYEGYSREVTFNDEELSALEYCSNLCNFLGDIK